MEIGCGTSQPLWQQKNSTARKTQRCERNRQSGADAGNF